MDKRVVVIGGGPGGYEAAIELAKLGAKVSIIEKEHLGGTCLNCGCIPTKTLLAGAQNYTLAKTAEVYGVSVENCTIDYAKLAKYKDDVVGRLRSGVQFLMRKNKIEVISGCAAFVDQKHVAVDGKTIEFDAAIIATGSQPAMPPIPGIDGKDVLNSTDVLNLTQLPKTLAVIGGGVIGLELSAVFMQLGVEVTILEACEQILPEMDADVVESLLKLSGMGKAVNTNCKVQQIADSKAGKSVRYLDAQGKEKELLCEKVLVATGRRAYTQGMRCEGIGIAMERGRIVVDETFKTNIEGIYAVGDVNGKAQLAHAATSQGRYVANVIMGKIPQIKTNNVPWCVFTEPELAGVGLSEKQAKREGIDYQVATYSFAANGKAMTMGKTQGSIRILYGSKYHEILGCKIVGPHATDLIGEMALAISLESTLEELANTMHPHPTLCEALADAARI